MTYTILDRREETHTFEYSFEDGTTEIQNQTSVFTLVEYNFDGILVEVEVAHFMPPDEAYIILGIENRAVTEQRKLGLIP